MFQKWIWLFLVLIVGSNKINGQSRFICPESTEISPCSCSVTEMGPALHCSGSSIVQSNVDNVFSLSRQLNNISTSNYMFIAFFFMSETMLTSLNLAPFALTNFKDIRIERNPHLEFLVGGTNSSEEIDIIPLRFFPPGLYLHDNKLGAQAVQQILKFVDPIALRTLRLDSNSIETIPLDAFKPFVDLETLDLSYNKIPSIVNSEFSNNLKIVTISLRGNGIEMLGQNGFLIENESSEEEYVFVDLTGNDLTDGNIHPDHGLNETRRIVSLNLSYNNLEIISQENFEHYLQANERNELFVNGNPLICDERMKWLKDGKAQYQFRVYHAYCTNDPTGKSVFETDLIS